MAELRIFGRPASALEAKWWEQYVPADHDRIDGDVGGPGDPEGQARIDFLASQNEDREA